jgi:hypothetical protein
MRFAWLAPIALFASVAHARPSLDQQRLGRLGSYEVLVFGDPVGGGLERGKAIGVFDATPEEVFRVTTDYAKWKDYLPKIVDSRVIDGANEKKGALVSVTAELPWPVGSSQVDARYVAEKLPGEIYRVRFWMEHGSMKQYVGAIYIEPWTADARKAAVTYELAAEPDLLAPKYAINKLVRRTAWGFVNALRQRINDLHQLGYLHPILPREPKVAEPPLDDLKAKR